MAGAGIAGLVVALGLAEAGTQVTLVDPAPGGGASGRGAGAVASGLAEHPARLADALGIERAAALLRLTGRSMAQLERLGVPLVRCDQVWIATAPNEAAWIARSVEALRQMGAQAELLEAEDLAARGLRGTLGFVTSGDALIDDPGAALAALAALAVDRGVTLVRGRVDEIVATSGGVTAVVDAVGIEAEVVVWAAAHGHGERGLSPLVWPVREQGKVVALPRPLAPMVGRAGHGWTQFRPLPGGRALVTGCRWATPHFEVGETDAVTVDAVQERLGSFAADHLGAPPQPPDQRWAWITAHTCDGLPLVGPMPGDPRTLVCTGFGGNDWGLGPATAALLVDGLVGSATTPVPWLAPSRMV